MFKRLFTAVSIFSVLFFAWYFQSIQPVTRLDVPTIDFEIKSGDRTDKIANDLSSARLIRSRVAFKLTVIRLGVANRIQAGYFKLSPSMSTTEVAEALTKAYAKQIRVTIPEGLRSEEINLIIDKAFKDVPDKKFNSKEFEVYTKSREGYLFPDTYDFPLTATAQYISEKLFSRFDEVAKSLGLDIQASLTNPASERLVIIASLLEREAANSDEMPLVAGVIMNRLNINMALQIDATVQYALGSTRCKQLECDWWKQNLTREDISFKSPFNTYANPGLPPSPISNPGKDALSAAANPAKTSAFYYIHDSSGKIHFADTLDQHNQNVCTYLKKDCN